MKKSTWIWIALAAGAYWYWMRKKKTGTNAPSAQAASSMAKQIVADVVDNTTFVPADNSFKEQYKQDQNACR